jgi:gliding motility-associated-like protein
VCNCFGQGSSNKGTDFWLGYGKHISVGNMVLYITSDVNTTSTVTIPALGFTQTVSVIANTVVPVDIPTTAHLNVDGLSSNGIHITSLKPVIVYAHIYDNAVSGATLVLPVNTLGKDYYSINYKQISNAKGSVSWFFVVAVEDNTTVEITPSGDTQGGWLANVKQTITLNKGQIYNVLGKFTDNGTSSSGVDLTGSRIKSISSNGTCKRIAVFSGSSKIAINCLSYNFTGANPGSADNLFQQVYPTATWGKNFITVPQKDRNFVIYRVLKSDPTAVVNVNGVVVPSASFINNFYYDFASQQVDQVTSDKPIQLVQYAVTQGKSITCGTASGDVGDPEMIYLNPLEQTLTQITMYSTDRYKILKHFINVVVKNEGVPSFKLDGLSASSNFSPVPGNLQYSYAQISVQSGTHNLSSDVGFNAIAYGFGNAESYGYAAGANLTSFGIEPVKNGTDSTSVATGCVGTPYNLNLKLPYEPLDIQLDKLDGTGLKYITVKKINQTTKDGLTTYIYSLLPNLIYTKDTTYTYKVRTTKPSADDCGTGDEFTFDFIVNPKPIADFSVPAQTCYSDSVKFKKIIVNSKIILNGYLWDFNGEGSSTLENPIFKFATPGVKKINFSVKSQDGCWSDVTTKNIEIMQQPVASFTTSAITCLNQAIQFTDASTTVGQTISKWEWDFGDGSPISNDQNPTHTFTTVKTFDVKLKVTTSLGCTNTKITQTIINPLPVPNFDAPPVCIYDSFALFTNTSTIADNSILSFEWNFGDPSSGANNTSTDKNPKHIYTQANVYNVSLIVTSASGCVFTVNKPFTVNPRPIANFSAPLNTCFGDVTAFSNNAVSGQTITDYLWDFSNEGNSTMQNPTFTFATVGIKKIKFSVKSSDGCWSDIVEKDITIRALPVVDFQTNGFTCANNDIQFMDKSTVSTQTITQWLWDFGDPTSSNNSSTLQNPSHIFKSAGNYTVSLTAITDLGCSKTLTKIITIHPLPIADFNTPDICLDDASASFTNTTTIPDNSTLTYLWNFGDPISGSLNTSTLKNPTHKYIQAKLYNVTLTATNANSCVTTIIKPFTVNGSTPKAIFNVQNQSNLCSDQIVSFEDFSTIDFGEITRIDWYYDDAFPTVIETDNQPDKRANKAKVYTHKYLTFYSPAQRTVNVKMIAYSGNSSTCVSTIIKTITLKAIPKTDFSLPDGCLPNGEAKFTNQSTFLSVISGLTYLWDFGDDQNNTSTDKDPTHQFKAAKDYTIKLTTTAPNGCSTTISKIFTVKAAIANPDFSVTNPNDLCSSEKVIFTDITTLAFGTVNKIEWQYDLDNHATDAQFIFVDNNPVGRTSNTYSFSYPVFTSPATQTVNVKMKVTTGTDCLSEIVKTITLKAVPKALFDVPNSCLPNGEAKFNNNSTFVNTTTGLTYLWDFGDDQNNTSTDKDPIHQYKAAKDYTIKLTTTAANGCSNTISKTFTVTAALPNPNFSVVNDDLCSSFKVLFRDEASIAFGEIIKIDWQFDVVNHPKDPAFSVTDNNPNFRADAAKIYEFSYAKFNSPLTKDFTVTMTTTSASGCVSEISKIITLKAVPNVEFTAIPVVCEEFEPFNITQGSETSGFVGKGVYSGAGIDANGLFSPKIAGIGTHTITYNFFGDNGCGDFKTQDITVNPTPVVNAGDDKIILIGGEIKLDATASGNDITYKWSPSTSLDHDDILNPIASPTKDTKYTLLITSKDGCINMDDVFVKVLLLPEIPNTFTPNGDGVNDTWDIKYLSSYPSSTVQIFNRNGSLVFSSARYTTPWDGKFNNKDLPSGMYYYIITAKQGELKYSGSVLIVR